MRLCGYAGGAEMLDARCECGECSWDPFWEQLNLRRRWAWRGSRWRVREGVKMALESFK